MKRFFILFIVLLIGFLFVGTIGAFVHAVTANLTVQANVQVTVTVLPVYRLSEDLNILNSGVYQGDQLQFTVDLKKQDLVKGFSGKINVSLSYEILQGNKVVKSGLLQTITMTKCSRETLSISIPKDFATGTYTLIVNATSPQAYSASDKDTFTVKKKR